jgi:stearoyl-CoA desaturase (delta-9 desaturase)
MQQTGIQRGESHRVIAARLVVSHGMCLGVFFVPVTAELLWAAVIGYFVRMFFIEAGAHRYFAHRAFRTSRLFQAVLALGVAASGQRGPIWWAGHHRKHHRLSDRPGDPHSPMTVTTAGDGRRRAARGRFWHAHLGWLVRPENLDTDLDAVKDLARFPELVFINKTHMLWPIVLLVATVLVGATTPLFGREGLGWSAAVWAFFVPTVLSLHGIFVINSLTHGGRPGRWHRRRFLTNDFTTNVWWLAIPTMGAAWHNNHHRYMNAARAGFYRWEIDPSYVILRGLARLRIVWDLHEVPSAVLEEGHTLESQPMPLGEPELPR